jgi:hypothetical protein
LKDHFKNDLYSLIKYKYHSDILLHKMDELFIKSFTNENIKKTKELIIQEIQSHTELNEIEKKQSMEMVEYEFLDIKKIRSRFDLEVRLFLQNH